jgi:hypothetical protein
MRDGRLGLGVNLTARKRLAGGERLPLARPGERPPGFGAFTGCPGVGGRAKSRGGPALAYGAPANGHDAPFAQPLLATAVRLYRLRPRVVRLDAGYWGCA